MSFKCLARTFIRILTNWFCCLLIDCAIDNNQLTDMLQVFFECNKNRNQAIRQGSSRTFAIVIVFHGALDFFQIH
jgi:hypothetical protein